MNPLLSVHEVSKKFGGLTAVDRVSFTVNEGEVVGIIGPNGAGKTTLFNMITGFMKPSQGEIQYRGQSITGWKPYRISRLGIARTFQVVKPLSQLNVLDNVTVAALGRAGTVDEARRIAQEVLELVGLTPYLDSSAGDLPIGLKKKLELAKALATGPDVLFLDEVMGGLTPGEVRDMIDVLKQVRDEGVTLVMIEHVLKPIFELCPRTLVLHHGRLIADGPTEEVMKEEEVVKAYLGEAISHA